MSGEPKHVTEAEAQLRRESCYESGPSFQNALTALDNVAL
jgi:hypothetical protein